MSDLARSTIADQFGNALITFADVPSGLLWTVHQISVEVPNSTAVQVVCTLRKNNRYFSSTKQGIASSASGPPALLLRPGDSITVQWQGLNAGDNAIANLFYVETNWTVSAPVGIPVV